jgi:surfeit locus 1 family protein
MTQQNSMGRLIGPAMVAMAGVALLISLGVWQLHRREWKEDLIRRIESHAQAASLALTEALAAAQKTGPGEIEYYKVRMKGRFDHAREHHLYALFDGAPGWRVVTPMETAGGVIVLVDRGFVPAALKDPASRAQGQVEGEIELTGAIRRPGAKDWLGPENDPQRNQWYWRDLTGMAANGDRQGAVAPFFVEAEASAVPGGWPKGAPGMANLPNRHLEYALTWFALALTLLAVFAAFAYSRIRTK